MTKEELEDSIKIRIKEIQLNGSQQDSTAV